MQGGKMNNIIISQIIPTIQGEGPSIGTPILLIRLGNCNLDCSFCDSKWSNNLKLGDLQQFNPEQVSYPFVLEDDNIEKFIKFLNKEFLYKYKIHTILLTGGEPFLNKLFIKRIVFNFDLSYISKIEIETNGTLLDEPDDYKIFEHWSKTIQINISPKLNPDFYRSKKITDFDDIITLFNNNISNSISKIELLSPTTICWKFVYSNEEKEKIDMFIREISNIQNINIMPLTPNFEDFTNEKEFLESFRKSSYDTIEYCLNTGHIFNPRAHVWVFNNFEHRNEYLDVMKER
jgi:7-carboxy-7-deazaguanine synthase